jgi:hypothetical protein
VALCAAGLRRNSCRLTVITDSWTAAHSGSSPPPAVLATAWQVVSKAHANDIKVPVVGLDNSQKVSLEAKLLDPKDTLYRRILALIA